MDVKGFMEEIYHQRSLKGFTLGKESFSRYAIPLDVCLQIICQKKSQIQLSKERKKIFCLVHFNWQSKKRVISSQISASKGCVPYEPFITQMFLLYCQGCMLEVVVSWKKEFSFFLCHSRLYKLHDFNWWATLLCIVPSCKTSVHFLI